MRRRRWFAWHGTLGCTAGLLLFVICWSGTVAVFSREIDWLIDARLRAPASEAIAWGAAFEALREAYPEREIVQLNAGHARGFALEAWTEDAAGVMGRLYADPATGAPLGATSYFNVQRFFRSLHMCLFLASPWGYWIVGALGGVLLASLATALGFWSRFWRGVRLAPWRADSRRSWSDVHKLAGLTTLWFVALIGATGLWYLVEPYLPDSPTPVLAARGGGARAPSRAEIERAVAASTAASPGFAVRAIAFGDAGSGVLELHGQDGSWVVRDRAAKVWVGWRTGEVLATQRVADLTLYQRWIDTADPLHFGSFGGVATKVVWFACGLALSALCLSGARLTREVRDGPAAHGMRFAYAVTLGVLALALAAGHAEIRGYGAGGADWPRAPAGVVAFIALWIASTCAALAWWMSRPRAPRLAGARARAAAAAPSSGAHSPLK
jgi:uncharacterized iron-regulated membrane protein